MGTVKIKHTDAEGNDHMIIEEGDFNPDTHELYSADDAPSAASMEKARSAIEDRKIQKAIDAQAGQTTGQTSAIPAPGGKNPSGTFSEPTPTDIRFPNKDMTEFENNRGAFRRKSAADLRKEQGLPDVPGGVLGGVLIPDAWRSLKAKEQRELAEQLTGKEDLSVGEAKAAIATEVKRREDMGQQATHSDEEMEALAEAQEKQAALEDEGEEAADDFDTMTVAELKAYAADNDIDIGDASRKADIIEALRGADAEKPE